MLSAKKIYIDSHSITERHRGASDMGKTEKQILQVLSDFGPLTLPDIANELGKKPKAVFKSLRKLFDQGKITNDPRTRLYMLIEEE